jgi:hypothetical protein
MKGMRKYLRFCPHWLVGALASGGVNFMWKVTKEFSGILFFFLFYIER